MPPHVNDSKWVSTGHRFAFVALFSGALSTLLAAAIAIYIGVSGNDDIIGYFLKSFAFFELALALLILVFMSVFSALHSFRSKRNTFRSSWKDLFNNVEQVWFYIPLNIALLIYLVFGGV